MKTKSQIVNHESQVSGVLQQKFAEFRDTNELFVELFVYIIYIFVNLWMYYYITELLHILFLV